MEVLLRKPEKVKHFLHGFSSIFDITGRTYTTEVKNELSGFQKDYLAMRGDWINIGNDCRKAINKVMYGK